MSTLSGRRKCRAWTPQRTARSVWLVGRGCRVDGNPQKTANRSRWWVVDGTSPEIRRKLPFLASIGLAGGS